MRIFMPPTTPEVLHRHDKAWKEWKIREREIDRNLKRPTIDPSKKRKSRESK